MLMKLFKPSNSIGYGREPQPITLGIDIFQVARETGDQGIQMRCKGHKGVQRGH